MVLWGDIIDKFIGDGTVVDTQPATVSAIDLLANASRKIVTREAGLAELREGINSDIS